MTLNGTLPSSWSNMTNLYRLHLSFLEQRSSIPDSWRSLVNLVDFRAYSLNGTFDVINGWKNLESLELFSCNFDGSPLPCRNETTDCGLRLCRIRINTANVAGTLPSFWCREGVGPLYVDLIFNSIAGTLPPEWGELPFASQSTVILSYNQFNGTIPLSYASFIYLGLAKNFLHGELPLRRFAGGFDLAHNRLNGTLPESWVQSSLFDKPVSLAHNLLRGTFPVSWWNISVSLDLQNNSLSGTLPPVPAGSQLFDVTLNFNQFTGPLPEIHPTALLRRIDVSGNQFDSLPDSWSKLPDTLYSVNARNNQIRGTLPSAWSNWNRTASTFRVISFNNNQISGTLPPSWAKLRLLFYAENNQIYGPIPLEWAAASSNITSLILSNNRLSGTLPRFQSPWMHTLFLANNSLHGTIPNQLGKALSFIHLQQNLLTGTLPNVISQSDYLVEVNVSFNNLTGMVPTGWVMAEYESVGAPCDVTCSSQFCVPAVNTTYCDRYGLILWNNCLKLRPRREYDAPWSDASFGPQRQNCPVHSSTVSSSLSSDGVSVSATLDPTATFVALNVVPVEDTFVVAAAVVATMT
jgi:hypothetical protein